MSSCSLLLVLEGARNMLPPALRMSLWIRSIRKHVKDLIMEEGETFENLNVGYRPCSYLRSKFSDSSDHSNSRPAGTSR